MYLSGFSALSSLSGSKEITSRNQRITKPKPKSNQRITKPKPKANQIRTKGDDNISNLLLDEHPLQIMSTLATIIGLNESIVLQQVHYWLKIKEKSQKDYIDSHYWVYNSYKQWQEQFPFWHLNTIQRTFSSLEKKGILISGHYNPAGFDKTKWYTINYDMLEALISSYQNGVLDTPNWCDGTHQNGVTNTIDYPKTSSKTSFKVLQGATPTRSTAFDWSILKKQIIGACNRAAAEDPQPYIDIIEYYYQTYMNTFHEEHPRLSNKAMDDVVTAIQCGTEVIEDDSLNVDMYRAMIDKHFQTQYKNCDYNIYHFMTDGIRNNRFHEVCY